MKKKIDKKTKLELEFLKDILNNKKQVYNSYIKALLKYNIKELAYQAIMYDDLNHNLLVRNMKECEKSNQSFTKLMFGDFKEVTEIEREKESIKHYDKLIERCRDMIESTMNDVKEKIAKDAVEKSLKWLNTTILKDKIVKKKSGDKK
jgi:hypothetical protein